MVVLTVQTCLATGLDPALGSAVSVELEDTPLGEGGFGVVHRVLSIDGRRAPTLVVKLLTHPTADIARRGFDTIQSLQRRLTAEQAALGTGGSLLAALPALLGAPHLSFEGTLSGRPVLGYACYDLGARGMRDFGRILNDDNETAAWHALAPSAKLEMAAHLVNAFDFLANRLGFIHADIKAQAIFVDPDHRRCAIIDYDSGALTTSAGDRPTTFGTTQDWLAPEILAQLAPAGNTQRAVHVDLLSDVWSINIAIHYLLFGTHPLFFLRELSPRATQAYFRAWKWPEVDATFPYFRHEYAALYPVYRAVLAATPAGVVRRLEFTINRGYAAPTERTTLGQWRTELAQATAPAILSFTADRAFVSDLRPVTLRWETTGAAELALDGVGDVSGRSGIDVPVRHDTTFTLTLTGHTGAVLTRSTRVTVSRAPPQIQHFDAGPTWLAAPGPVRLAWRVSADAESVILEGVGPVDHEGEISIVHSRPAVHRLVATSPFGVSAAAEVAIGADLTPPTITAFTAHPTLVLPGTQSTLGWECEGAVGVRIDPLVGSHPSCGSIPIRPDATTSYRLVAESAFGALAEACVSVSVLRPTDLSSFRPTSLADVQPTDLRAAPRTDLGSARSTDPRLVTSLPPGPPVLIPQGPGRRR